MEMMKYSLFSEDMKLGELVLANGSLLCVLSHLGVEPGFGEKTVKQVCDQYGINTELFLFVCNLYTFDDFLPASSDLNRELAAEIVGYLIRAHREYREYCIPKLLTQITALDKYCEGDILTNYCEQFSREVYEHFDYEERVAFPKILAIMNGDRSCSFKPERFVTAHRKMELALNDLKNVLVKYLPQTVHIREVKDVMLELLSLESDFDRHLLLEEEILFPYILNLMTEK